MSQENVERLYRAYDAFNRRDLDAYPALMDPEVELTPRIMELEGGSYYRGHDGVREWWRTLFAVFPDFSAEILVRWRSVILRASASIDSTTQRSRLWTGQWPPRLTRVTTWSRAWMRPSPASIAVCPSSPSASRSPWARSFSPAARA